MSEPLAAPAAAELGAEALAAKNALDSFLANYRAGDLIGHRRLNVSQLQATATKVFGPARLAPTVGCF